MKNWVLWLVVSLLFIGGATTFFILWWKEKKKNQSPVNGGVSTGKNVTEPGVNPESQSLGNAQAVEVTTAEVGGRSVSTVTPLSFGRTAN